MADENESGTVKKRIHEGDLEANFVSQDTVDARFGQNLIPSYSDDDSDAVEQPSPKRFRLDIADATTEEYEQSEESDVEEEELVEMRSMCPCCELATSDLMRDLDKVADRLAGKASHEHVTTLQLKIFENRVAPLRHEGRTDVPQITRQWLHRHYTECRISPMRSVSQDIRMFEEAEKLLRANMTDVDDEGTTVLSSRSASELCRISKGKLDALKFFYQLNRDREIKESNEKKS